MALPVAFSDSIIALSVCFCFCSTASSAVCDVIEVGNEKWNANHVDADAEDIVLEFNVHGIGHHRAGELVLRLQQLGNADVERRLEVPDGLDVAGPRMACLEDDKCIQCRRPGGVSGVGVALGARAAAGREHVGVPERRMHALQRCNRQRQVLQVPDLVGQAVKRDNDLLAINSRK